MRFKLNVIILLPFNDGNKMTIEPIDIKIPNADTVEAMKELADGGGKQYKNSQEMYDDLGI